MAAESNAAALEKLLRDHADEWVSAWRCAEAGGFLSFRSRITELRHQGLNIENRTVVVKQGNRRKVLSEYRLLLTRHPEGEIQLRAKHQGAR